MGFFFVLFSMEYADPKARGRRNRDAMAMGKEREDFVNQELSSLYEVPFPFSPSPSPKRPKFVVAMDPGAAEDWEEIKMFQTLTIPDNIIRPSFGVFQKRSHKCSTPSRPSTRSDMCRTSTIALHTGTPYTITTKPLMMRNHDSPSNSVMTAFDTPCEDSSEPMFTIIIPIVFIFWMLIWRKRCPTCTLYAPISSVRLSSFTVLWIGALIFDSILLMTFALAF